MGFIFANSIDNDLHGVPPVAAVCRKVKEGAEHGLRSLDEGRVICLRGNITQAGNVKGNGAGLVSASGRYHLESGRCLGDNQRNGEGLGGGIPCTLEIVGHRGTGDDTAVRFQRSNDIGREGITVSRRQNTMELHRVDAGLIDGEVRTARGVRNIGAVAQCITIKFQRIAGGSGLSGWRVSRQQADRRSGPGWTLWDGKVQDRVLGGTRVGYLSISTGITCGNCANGEGCGSSCSALVAGRASRASGTGSTGGACGASRTSRTGRPGRTGGASCTGRASNALRTSGTDNTSSTLRTGGTSCASGALRASGAAGTSGALRTSGASCTSGALRTGRPYRSGDALRPGRTGCASRTLRSGRSGRASGALRSGGASCTSGALRTGGPGRASGTLRPSGASCTSGTLRPGGTGCTRSALRTGGAGSSDGTLRPGGASRASSTLRTSGASCTSSTLRPGRTGRGDVKRKVPNYTYLYKSITLQNSRPGGTWTANC